MLNRIVLIGRLTRDPEVRTTTTGKNFATFSIAVNKKIKPAEGERDADFFNIKVWGQTATYVESYLTKGRLITVDGRMESRKYTDREGVNREIWEVVADNVSALDRPREDGAGGGGGGYTGERRSEGGARPSPAETFTSESPADSAYDPFSDA
ncbi:MAG: single-stranded DNA-binding protein [Fimbriimonadaceae bacterium]|nr:single-stranded DNA-binding protein [Fimbriimonadaceae bacterium]